MMRPTMKKIIVVGGGPAGSAAAIALAKTGEQVCLLERKPDVHDKVCGEFITWEAEKLLTHLGVDLAALGAQPISRVTLHSDNKAIGCELPFPAWSLSRRLLDAQLLNKARQAGVEVKTGVAVKDLHPLDSGWELTISENDYSTSERSLGTLKAATVFLATGKHDLHNWQRKVFHLGNYDLIGLKMHFHLDKSQQDELQKNVEIYFYNGGYAGLEPIENQKANLCFLIKRDFYKNCGGNWSCVLEWLCNTLPHLKKRLSGSTALWSKPLAISAVPYGYMHSPSSAMPGLFRIGDQTAVIHSLAGDGIAMALHSGRLAADVYAAGGNPATYYQQTQTLFGKPIRNAQIIADILSTTAGRNLAFFFARHWPGLALAAITRVRLNGV
jgi:flavin-dependent dehydrogenase